MPPPATPTLTKDNRKRNGMSPWKDTVKRIAHKTPITRTLRKIVPHRHAVILRYHSIQEPGTAIYASPGICVSLEAFERHVRYFTRNYAVITLDEFRECRDSGRTPPNNPVIFTFDDGYADNLEAAKVLARHSASGTFYISAGYVESDRPFWLSELLCLLHFTQKQSFNLQTTDGDRMFPLQTREERTQAAQYVTDRIKQNDLTYRESVLESLRGKLWTPEVSALLDDVFLNWDQIREMKRIGMDIGSHTMTHANLPNAGFETARDEIVRSKACLEESIQSEVRHFSYPNGGPYKYFNNRIKNFVKEAGYWTSTTSINGLADLDGDPYEIHRTRIVTDLYQMDFEIESENLALSLRQLFRR